MNKQVVSDNKTTIASFEIIDRCLIIKLEQDLDHHSAMCLREKSDRVIDMNNVKNIIFDFEKSTFMDSSGIGMIMGRYKKVIFIGGKVAVTNVTQGVDRIFKVSGLYKIMDKYNTVEDALNVL